MIRGQDINHITSGDGYNSQILYLWVGDDIYKMKVEEILKFNTDFNSLKFKKVKKRIHTYLEVEE